MSIAMTVLDHQPVGAYIDELTFAASRPATLKAFMEGLAAFVSRNGPTVTAGYDAGSRTWSLSGCLVISGVDEDAGVNYSENTAGAISLRMPDKEVLSSNRALAKSLDAANNPTTDYLADFYRDFLAGGGARPSHSEFLDCRLADYLFASCR